jgi:hypothetical protein
MSKNPAIANDIHGRRTLQDLINLLPHTKSNITKTKRLLLFGDLIAVYSRNNVKQMNMIRGQNIVIFVVCQSK